MDSLNTASDTGGEPGARRGERALWVLVWVLVALRFVALGRWGLWIDEAHTLNDAAEFAHGTSTAFPFGLAATWTAIKLLGSTDEFALRFAPALFGALGLLVCVWTFEAAVGRRRALVVAALVGLSSWHLYWSQSARAYTLAQDLALLGGGMVLRGCVQRSPWRFVLGLVTAAIAAFAHPSAGLLAPALMFAPFLSDLRGKRLAWRPPLWTVALVAVGLLACLGGWAHWVWSEYVERKSGSSSLHLALTCGWLFTPVLALGALGGAWSAWRGSAVDRIAFWVCALVLAVAFTASMFVVVSAQYVFVLLPWVALLASAPLFESSLIPRWRTALAGALALWGVVDLALYFTVRHGDRPRWNEAYAWVWEQRGRDDLIFGMAWPSGEYYLAPGATDLRVPGALARLSAYHSNALAQWPRRGRREWFIVNQEDLLAWDTADRQQLIAMLAEQCEKVRTFNVPATPRKLAIEIYMRDGSPEKKKPTEDKKPKED